MKTGQTVLLLGATGTIGRATYRTLMAHGHTVICPNRDAGKMLAGMATVPCDFSANALQDLCEIHKIDTVISCVASRTGTPDSARAIDRDINRRTLNAAFPRALCNAKHTRRWTQEMSA